MGSEYWVLTLDQDLVISAAFSMDVSERLFAGSDLLALAEAKVESRRWLEGAESRVEAAAASLMVYNVTRLQRFAADNVMRFEYLRFATRGDELIFRAWAQAIVEECEIADVVVSERFQSLIGEEHPLAVRRVEEAAQRLFQQVAPLHKAATQGLPVDESSTRISPTDDSSEAT